MKSILCDDIFHFNNLELSRVLRIPAFLEKVKTRGSASSTANAKAFFEERFDDVTSDKACFEQKQEEVSRSVTPIGKLTKSLTVGALLTEVEVQEEEEENQ